MLTHPIVVKDGPARLPGGFGWGTDINEDALKESPRGYTPVESEAYLEF